MLQLIILLVHALQGIMITVLIRNAQNAIHNVIFVMELDLINVLLVIFLKIENLRVLYVFAKIVFIIMMVQMFVELVNTPVYIAMAIFITIVLFAAWTLIIEFIRWENVFVIRDFTI
jgi:hypothetical protein